MIKILKKNVGTFEYLRYINNLREEKINEIYENSSV